MDALESKLSPTLLQVVERLNWRNIEVREAHVDAIDERCIVAITAPMFSYLKDELELALDGLLGEVVVHEENDSAMAFNAEDAYQSLATVTVRTSLLFIDGKYKQDLAACQCRY